MHLNLSSLILSYIYSVCWACHIIKILHQGHQWPPHFKIQLLIVIPILVDISEGMCKRTLSSFVKYLFTWLMVYILYCFSFSSFSVPLHLPDILMLEVHWCLFSFYNHSLPDIVQFHGFLCGTLNKIFRVNS